MTIPKINLKEPKWALCDKEEGVLGISEVSISVPLHTAIVKITLFTLGCLNSAGQPPLTKSWDYRRAFLQLVSAVLEIKPGLLCMLDKHTTN